MALSGAQKDGRVLRIHESLDELRTDLAEYIAEISEACVKERGIFAIALSGGSLVALMRYIFIIDSFPFECMLAVCISLFNGIYPFGSKFLLLKAVNCVKPHITRQLTGPNGIYSGLTNVLWQKIMLIATTSWQRIIFCPRYIYHQSIYLSGL